MARTGTGKPIRSTVYLDLGLHHALNVQAAETSSNISELVNRAVRDALLEDREDLSAFEDRASEPTLSFDEMRMRLGLKGDLRRCLAKDKHSPNVSR